jgi:DNA helicase HerA-like ATPase
MEIELFSEGFWSFSDAKLAFSRGVSTYPLPRQGVYLLTRDEATLLYRSAEGQVTDGADPLVPFGRYLGTDSAFCRANIDKMFGMHCAVLGSTGSGKSGAVAALLHSVLEHKPLGDTPCRPQIIIIDPHGEYGQAFQDRSVVYRAYDPIGTDETAGVPVVLPYWLMSAEELRFLVIGKTEAEATSQHNIVYKALTHARMVAAELVNPAPTTYGDAPTDGNSPDHPRPKGGVDPAALASFDRDKPRPFDWDEFENHIIFLQAARPNKANKLESIPSGEFSEKFKSILDKLSVLRRDPRIRFLMDTSTKSSRTLADILTQFVGSTDSDAKIRIIDISGLPNEVAGPLAAMLARLLFQYKLHQTQEERRKDPILLVCEEAHRYVPDRGDAEYAAAQSAIRRIAREGRKYGLGLMLVSQRPADVESTVIAQCGTWLVLRLTNAADQAHVARFLPDGLSGMTRALPALGQQEALFVGEGASLPARIRIRDLTASHLPRSESVRFSQGWAGECPSADEIATVAARMTGRVAENITPIKEPALAWYNTAQDTLPQFLIS